MKTTISSENTGGSGRPEEGQMCGRAVAGALRNDRLVSRTTESSLTSSKLCVQSAE
jgi:hypothetical protein